MNDDILDTEIRIIGQSEPQGSCANHGSGNKKKPKWWLIAVGVLVVIAGIVAVMVNHSEEEDEIGVYESAMQYVQPHPLRAWLQSIDTVTRIGTITKDSTVNDIPIRIYVPMNAIPRLEVGYGVIERRKENVLLFQAADVRADNKKIVGAFVLRGQPLSWGLSKKGYCAIVDNQVTVGVADNSPLFEEATDKGGYFFRQYPLVDKGQMVENAIKSQSIRRGLCEIEGKIVVVETQTNASLHDFSQLLVDIGTDNAIYLVGSTAIGWSCDMDGNGTKMGLWDERIYKNVSFVVWSR